MSLADDRPISGYGSRLESLAASAIDRFRSARNSASSQETALQSFLREGFQRGLKLEHLLAAFEHVLTVTDYPQSERTTLLDRATRLSTPGTYRLTVTWRSKKPSPKEIAFARAFLPELAGTPALACKQKLEQSSAFLLGTYPTLLEAEAAKERADQLGLATDISQP